jgi:glycosyltransferase involved in cell wall biosynthesis
MKSQLISVIIPTYNRGHVIQRAIQSVLDQTYKDLEVIVIDDGSKDDTRSVLEQQCEADSRIRCLFVDSNKGAQAARNMGIRASQGEWISFLDSDDYWYPQSLEVRLIAAQQQRVKVVHSGFEVIRENGIQESLRIPCLGDRAYRALLTHPGPVFQALLVAREAFEKIGYLDEDISAYQEWDTSIRLARYYKFGFVPESTFVYDCRGTNTISKDLLRNAAGYEQIVRKHRWEILRVAGIKPLVENYQMISKFYLDAGILKKARFYQALVFGLRPSRQNIQNLWQIMRQ